MNDPLETGLRHLAEQFSVSRDEWRAHHRGDDLLLDGLVSHGYAIERGDRYAVSDAGRARLADAEIQS